MDIAAELRSNVINYWAKEGIDTAHLRVTVVNGNVRSNMVNGCPPPEKTKVFKPVHPPEEEEIILCLNGGLLS